mgnify:CR=1 FL=1
MLYGLPKVDKTGIPLRPVVSYVSAPTYLLAKFLDRWFKSTTDFTPLYSVKNSVTLVDKIKHVDPPPGSSLISFDVVALFPRVPRAPTLQAMGELLVSANCDHEVITEFFNLIRISVSASTSFTPFAKKSASR